MTVAGSFGRCALRRPGEPNPIQPILGDPQKCAPMIFADAFVLRSVALLLEDVQENGTNGTTIYFHYFITELPNGTIAELDRNFTPVPALGTTLSVPVQFRASSAGSSVATC